MRASATLTPAMRSGVHGEVRFMDTGGRYMDVVFDVTGLRPGKHGVHVHNKNLRHAGDPCSVACDHYNPTGDDHGSATSLRRHRGDMGNIVAGHDGSCRTKVRVLCTVREIIDKIVVVHAGEDDLGLGSTPSSKVNGNAGAKVACGFILQEM